MQWGGVQAIIVIEREKIIEKNMKGLAPYTSERVGPQLIIWIRDKEKNFGREKMYFQNLFKFSAVFDYWQRIVVRKGFK